jgi:hypothetical protein
MEKMVTTGKVLAETFAASRQMTRYYLSKLKESDPTIRHNHDGIQLNSAYWIIAHLIWAEDMLMLRCMGHKGCGVAWLDQFEIASDPSQVSIQLSFKELLDLQKEVHGITLLHLAQMTEDEFAEENSLGIDFGGEKSKKFMALHGIRHEGVHTGHLGIIAKLAGVKTI